MNKNMRKQLKYPFFLTAILISSLLATCKKSAIIGEDPYAGGKAPLGVTFGTASPSPASGPAGSTVVFQVKGLLKYGSNFDFLISNQKTTILNVTDTTITIKVPTDISSGISSIKLGGQVFFGPRFAITGNISIDAGFGAGNGTDGPIYSAYEFNQGYMILGSFLRYEGSYYPGIAFVNSLGGIGNLNTRDGMNLGGSLLSVARLASGKFIIAGNYNLYYRKGGIGNITRINSDGSLDAVTVNVINQIPEIPSNGLDTVPAFNGAFRGQQTIIKTFVTSDNKVIAVGNINSYTTIDYTKSTRLSRAYTFKNIFTVARMNENGILDETYNYGPTSTGANALVNDAFMQTDGKVVLVGNFTKFNGVNANYIVRLDKNGQPDATYLTGTGANGNINTVQYNSTSRRIMVTGNFTTFNNKACPGIAMLMEDGSLDANFKFGDVTGGNVNFARSLKNGKVLVAGTFDQYNGVSRPGFLLLNADGSALQTFNHLGTFSGQIQQVIETTSTIGAPAIILLGYIRKFDDKNVNNIVKVEIKN